MTLMQLDWEINENDLKEFKLSSNAVTSNIVCHDECRFMLHWEPYDSIMTALSLQLTALNNAIGSMIIDHSITCIDNESNALLWSSQDQNKEKVRLRTQFDSQECGGNKSCAPHSIPSKVFFEGVGSIKFICKFQVLAKYDIWGGVFSHIDEPIFLKATSTNDKLVCGYLNDIFDFDCCEIAYTPSSIYELIYKYFLMIFGNNESGKAEFEWKFDNDYALQSFWNCKHSDILTSKRFELNGCVCYFELTPNGWMAISEGSCVVWLAVHSLPKGMSNVNMRLRVECDAIGFDESKEQWLTSPENGQYSFSTGGTHMQREDFSKLKQFALKLTVEIIPKKSDSLPTVTNGNGFYESDATDVDEDDVDETGVDEDIQDAESSVVIDIFKDENSSTDDSYDTDDDEETVKDDDKKEESEKCLSSLE